MAETIVILRMLFVGEAWFVRKRFRFGRRLGQAASELQIYLCWKMVAKSVAQIGYEDVDGAQCVNNKGPEVR